MKNFDKKIHFLHLPTTVGGNAQSISSALNRIGGSSETWIIKQNKLYFSADREICGTSDNILICELKKVFALSYIFKGDVLFLNFGRTLFNEVFIYDVSTDFNWKNILVFIYNLFQRFMQIIEIFLIRISKKIVFIQYQGDDARQGGYCDENFEISISQQVPQGYYSRHSDRIKRRNIRNLAKLSSRIYALNPDLLHVLPEGAQFLPYSSVNIKDIHPVYPDRVKGGLVFAHAPTNRAVKGTERIISAYHAVVSQGYNCSLELVEGVSNIEALKKYENSDIVIDQLFAGWYGVLAVEAMALGKPVIAYIRDGDLVYLPPEMRKELPIIRATPDSIEAVIRDVCTMSASELHSLGVKSRLFVERWHDPDEIARRILSDARDVQISKIGRL